MGVPPLLDAHGRAAGGDTAHAHPEELRLHALHHRARAGTKSTVTGEDFYGPYEAQELAKEHAAELEMEVVTYENIVYTGEEHGYLQESEAQAKGLEAWKLSGTEFRRKLRAGEDIPEWFAFKSVVNILAEEEAARD